MDANVKKITPENFEAEYAAVFVSLDKLAARQKTDAQRNDVEHRRRYLKADKTFLASDAVEGYLFVCSCCGSIGSSHYVDTTRQQILERGICFFCNYWYNIAESYRADPMNPKLLIINGVRYSDGGKKPAGAGFGRGGGGREYTIAFLSGGEPWTTNDLWGGGDAVPEEFRDLLPDNARFVK